MRNIRELFVKGYKIMEIIKVAVTDTEQGCEVRTKDDVANDVKAHLETGCNLAVSDPEVCSVESSIKRMIVTMEDGDTIPASQVVLLIESNYDFKVVAPSMLESE